MGLTEEQSREIVREITDRVIKVVKQDLAGENEEFLPRVLRQFKSELARYTWKNLQKWSKWTDDGPVLMPDFTRIYYRKGKTEITLQEFPPQLRILRFKGSLVNRSDTGVQLSAEQHNSNHHFSVALPYVVFVFKYVEGKFVDARCAFNDRPLKMLDEKPLRPYLSNINSDLRVCLGGSFDQDKLLQGNITQQAAYVLDHFWNSTYSDEWSTHYWANRAHFTSCDERMSCLEGWQLASEENPLFVVEDVKWLVNSEEENFGDMIVKLLEDDQDNLHLHEELYDHLSENFLEQVKRTYADNVKSIADSATNKLVDELCLVLQEKLGSIQ